MTSSGSLQVICIPCGYVPLHRPHCYHYLRNTYSQEGLRKGYKVCLMASVWFHHFLNLEIYYLYLARHGSRRTHRRSHK